MILKVYLQRINVLSFGMFAIILAVIAARKLVESFIDQEV